MFFFIVIICLCILYFVTMFVSHTAMPHLLRAISKNSTNKFDSIANKWYWFSGLGTTMYTVIKWTVFQYVHNMQWVGLVEYSMCRHWCDVNTLTLATNAFPHTRSNQRVLSIWPLTDTDCVYVIARPSRGMAARTRLAGAVFLSYFFFLKVKWPRIFCLLIML